jgi:hypothetical protein
MQSRAGNILYTGALTKNMTAILSATEHDFYAMPLPIAVYSWAKLGINCHVFIPEDYGPKLALAKKWCQPFATFHTFFCEKKREATYSQVIRLFGAAIPETTGQVLITSDADICVFGNYFEQFEHNLITVAGADLTPADQYPMCFIGMRASIWRNVFGITKTAQEHVAELIDPIEGDNIRGCQWSYDQWYAKKLLDASNLPVSILHRAKPLTQFASHRADRDGWYFDLPGLVDAHLPRPLTDEANFKKVQDLFIAKYPNGDFGWMEAYRKEYMQLTSQP